MSKPYIWTVSVSIDPMWVADGFNLTPDRLRDILEETLPYASPSEYHGEVLTAPDDKRIRKEQGYE